SLASPVLFIFASQDQWINQNVVDEFRKAMMSANKPLEVKTYKADHAFANPSNPQFDTTATADAHKNAAEFFKKNLLK
ncbi:MAG TPA: dienelactone hydrolase family protein, partial [Bacteroidota bacterium]|nr:dienelactone hydrolase family protein [Bacteroidota bacterium]